jgi:SnoaL-like domain
MTPETPLDPAARIEAYFGACNLGSAAEIGAHFTSDAIVWDTNLEPCRGNEAIGAMWVTVRERWGGARWSVDRVVAQDEMAAIEWTMVGRSARHGGRSFAFRGSEHYAFQGAFRGVLIAEIRQYWTFDPERLDTGLVGYDHSQTFSG